ncbi:MAG: hypothetical protein HY347_05450 [candidate division NC10 bacterium]|nr:hypothetical protein [candidate division NC10 bacterium]
MRGKAFLWLVMMALLAGCPVAGWPSRATAGVETAAPPALFLYDLERMITSLEQLTGWDVAKIPRPRVEVLSPQEFTRRLNLDVATGIVFLGYYTIGREGRPDTILINRICLSEAEAFKLSSDALCHSTLLHELVHWVQTHRPLRHPPDRIRREREAVTWEERYLAQLRGSGSSMDGPMGRTTGPQRGPKGESASQDAWPKGSGL